MRRSLLSFVIAGPLVAACTPLQTDSLPVVRMSHISALQSSLLRWHSDAHRSEGHYRYSVRWQSAFGFGHVTTVTVRDGQVVSRSFEQWGRSDSSDQVRVTRQWAEQGDTIGTHGDGAAPALTLDQLYERCSELLRQPISPDEQETLSFDAAGLLKACYRRNIRVADDAPAIGVPHFDLTFG